MATRRRPPLAARTRSSTGSTGRTLSAVVGALRSPALVQAHTPLGAAELARLAELLRRAAPRACDALELEGSAAQLAGLRARARVGGVERELVPTCTRRGEQQGVERNSAKAVRSFANARAQAHAHAVVSCACSWLFGGQAPVPRACSVNLTIFGAVTLAVNDLLPVP